MLCFISAFDIADYRISVEAKPTLPKVSNVDTTTGWAPGFLTNKCTQPASFCFDVINRGLVFVSDLGFGRWILNRVSDR